MLLVLGFFLIIFLYSHLVNLTFVLLTDPSFIPQLQFICCSSTSFNSLFFLCLSLSSFPFFLRTFTISLLQRAHKHNVLSACKASGLQAYTFSRAIVCSYNVCTQSTVVAACLSCKIQITGQPESELHCNSKNLIFCGFILFTRNSRKRREYNLFNSLS